MSGIYRVRKNADYFVASNKPFNDKRLTWEARGVMGYLLSKPDGWECRNYDLVNSGPAGEHIIKRVMKELRQYHYVRRFRVSDGKGKIDWITEIYEDPEQNPDLRKGDIPPVEKPSVENSTVEKSHDIVSTNSVSTKSINTDIYTPPQKTKNQKLPEPLDDGADIADKVGNAQKFVTVFKQWLRQPYEMLTPGERLPIEQLGSQDGSDLALWENSVKEVAENSSQKIKTPGKVIEVYQAGGTWDKYIQKLNEEKTQGDKPILTPEQRIAEAIERQRAAAEAQAKVEAERRREVEASWGVDMVANWKENFAEYQAQISQPQNKEEIPF